MKRETLMRARGPRVVGGGRRGGDQAARLAIFAMVARLQPVAACMELLRPTMRYAAVWRETLHPGSLPIYDRRPNRQAVVSGDQAGPESGPKSTPANRPAMKPAVIKSSGVRTASTKAAVETTTKAATHAAVHAPTATAPTARRHNVGCKHSKRRSRQQRDRDFTEHD
jgi:hypothetical protein